MVTKDPMALITRVGVLTVVSWLNSQIWPSNHHGHVIMYELPIGSYILSPVTIPQVVAVNENMFSVNLTGKIRVKGNGEEFSTKALPFFLNRYLHYVPEQWISIC